MRGHPEDRRRGCDEEILGQFLGDASFPVDWDAGGREEASSGSSTTCTARTRVSPMFFDIGGWWLSCDHMFRRFGTPFASRLARQERQRLSLHAAIPADPALRIDATEYGARYGARVPRRRGFASDDGQVPRRRPAGLRPALRRLVARPPACRRCSATSPTSRASRRRRRLSLTELAVPARGRDRHPRPPLEDPLDAQLRPALGDARSPRGHGEDARHGRRGAAGAAPELRLGPQLGLDRGALADEERGPDDAELRAAFAPEDRARSRAPWRRPTAAAASSPSASSPTSASSAGTPSGATSSSSRPSASRWGRSSSSSAAISTTTTTSRPPSRRCGATSRPPRTRSWTG